MSTAGAREVLEAAHRTEARPVLATLIRLLGGFEAAEEALHEAFAPAANQGHYATLPSKTACMGSHQRLVAAELGVA